MEQRDSFQRQIDQLGLVLGKIFADLLGLKNQGRFNDSIKIISQSFKEELHLDIEQITNIRAHDLITTLRSEKHFNNNHLAKLADILLLMAENGKDKDNNTLYKQCLAIYEYLETNESVFSLDRQGKIEKIKKAL